MSNKPKISIAIFLTVVLLSSGILSARMRGDASQEGTQQQQPQQTQSQGVKISGGVKLSGGVKMSGLAKSPQGGYWLDKWREATISLGRVETDRNGRPFYRVIGTGFIATDSHKLFIVTAKHVFFDPERNWHPDTLNVRFAWEEGRSVYSDLGLPLPLVRATADLWTSPQDASDIAAIPMPETFAQAANPETHQFRPAWPSDMASPDDIYEGNSVIVLGYPGIVGNEYLVRAVSRSGIIAWVDPNPDAHGIFMVDANLNEGNSGGPVIAVPGGVDRDGGVSSGKRPLLLGLVSKGPKQDIVITAGGQPVIMSGSNLPQPSPLQGTVVGVGSFGVIEPGTKIKEFILSLGTVK
jgi:Trypsin-like peptidase domain